MSRMWTHTLKCDLECGATIELTSHLSHDNTMAVAEFLGWATVDKLKGKDVEVYCPHCLIRVVRISTQLGLGKK